MLPQQLSYNSVRPKGWYSRFKQWPIQPMSSNMYWNPNQIIRFQIQLTSGLLDPYRSHLSMTVQTPPAQNYPVGCLQFDNSAQTLISQMVLSSNNVEIQRICEYDTLSAYLIDIGFSDIVCARRQWQGMGYNNYEQGFMYNSNPQPCSMTGNYGNQFVSQNSIGHSTSPTKAYSPGQLAYTATGQSGTSATVFSNTSSHSSTFNYFVNIGNNTAQSSRNFTGRFANIRNQYKCQRVIDYVDTTTSFLNTEYQLLSGIVPNNWVVGDTMPVGKAYLPKRKTDIWSSRRNYDGSAFDRPQPLLGSLLGYNFPVNPRYSVGCNQPTISPTVPQAKFAYGQVLDFPMPVPTRRVKIPLLSSIIGVLIPADQFMLIPLSVLYNTLLQLTMNPYGMFTSGYNDVHQFDKTGMATQQKRAFRLNRVVYNLHIYEWIDQQIQQYITESITKEIILTSSSWALSAQYQIPTGQGVRNNWALSVNSQSLSQVVTLFLSNEYMKYSFCRKQFRLSNNIRSMQLKFNTDYYPPQPIVGNAGNPTIVDTSGDNSKFLEQILTSNNYLFVTNTPQPRINSFNFAVNGRCYDPSNQKPLYDNFMINNPNYVWKQDSINADTAMGQSSFHQNRLVGRAAFVYSFEPYAHSKNYMVGVDSRNARPFDIIFDTFSQNNFQSDQTMYVFSRSSVVVIYSSSGIKVIGR